MARWTRALIAMLSWLAGLWLLHLVSEAPQSLLFKTPFLRQFFRMAESAWRYSLICVGALLSVTILAAAALSIRYFLLARRSTRPTLLAHRRDSLASTPTAVNIAPVQVAKVAVSPESPQLTDMRQSHSPNMLTHEEAIARALEELKRGW